MQKSISEILASAVNQVHISKDALAEKIFRGVVKARARFDESLHDVALSNDVITVEPTGLAVSYYVDYLREKTAELCNDDATAELFCRAFQMNEAALDEACALIQSTFMPEKTMTLDMVLGAAGTPAGHGDHSVPSSKSTQMKSYLKGRADEYITLNNRMAAGSIFGIAETPEDRMDIDNQMIRIQCEALRHGIDNNKTGGAAPDPSQG